MVLTALLPNLPFLPGPAVDGFEEIVRQQRGAIEIGFGDEDDPLVKRKDVQPGVQAAEVLVLNEKINPVTFQEAREEN